MAKFRPSLLDTLLTGTQAADAEVETNSIFPGVRLYSLDRMTETAYLDTLRRDLSWLLNTVRLEDTLPLDNTAHVATSVVNFGIPDFAVRTLSSVNVGDAAESISKAIKTFEPRIEARSLAVRGEKTRSDDVSQALIFHIVCDVGRDEKSMHAGFKTQIDVETGHAELEQRR